MNPLNLPGPEFLKFYTVCLTVAGGCTFALRSILRPSGSDAPEGQLDVYDIAYLAGGPKRLATAALAALCRLQLIAQGITPGAVIRSGHQAPRLHVAEQAAFPSSDTKILATTVYGQGNIASQIRERLVEQGLVIGALPAVLVSLASALPLVLAICLGFAKVLIGLQRHRPVAFLVIMLVIAIVGLVWFLNNPPFRTRAGDRRLNELRDHHNALALNCQRSPAMLRSHEIALAVGIYGEGMMAHDSMTWLRKAIDYREPPATVAGESSCSSASCGSSGCGGGGCGGGCGGCGS